MKIGRAGLKPSFEGSSRDEANGWRHRRIPHRYLPEDRLDNNEDAAVAWRNEKCMEREAHSLVGGWAPAVL